jgi:16S rRNA (guanine966-N2)-methyltransferase
MSIRPTTDRVREALFSIIASEVPGARVLDLFAGTGALGLEALSRGAEYAVFVDSHPQSIRLIQANVALCRVQNRIRIIQSPIQNAICRLTLESERFHLIFMDPPYGKGSVSQTIPLVAELAIPGAIAIAEHHVRDSLTLNCNQWSLTEERRYGDTALSFFELTSETGAAGDQ